MWIAPNVVTLSGLITLILMSIIVFLICPSLIGHVPSSVYFLLGVVMFIYHTLDGMDGKQARRTNSSSPLGHCFDHGCDCLFASLSGIYMCTVFQTGSTWWSFVVHTIHTLTFFVSNWEESQTHVMRFGIIGPSEAHFFIILLCFISAFQGEEFMFLEVFGYHLQYLIISLAFVSGMFSVCEIVMNVINHWKSLNISPVRGILSYSNYVCYLIFAYMWVSLSHSSLFLHSPIWVLGALSLIFANISTRLIVASVTKTQNHPLQASLWPCPLVLFNTASRLQGNSSPLIDELLAAQLLILYEFILYSHYVISVIQEMCSTLGIQAFTITSKPIAQVQQLEPLL